MNSRTQKKDKGTQKSQKDIILFEGFLLRPLRNLCALCVRFALPNSEYP
ncbi:hypothetical protein GGD71_004600 [Variovorax guangxiensis]|uniref:Uncharacterized protein n=1 Tax=Variovorax guangxiensis TaxID=1775474 RepID=A0A840FU28_9BURK|nr:hypothetical protein [Variovorax guangxiensis]